MKRTLLTFILLLTSCSFNHGKVYDYQDVENLKIQANDILNLAKTKYFVYIYNLNCYYCNLIKQDIISYALSNKYPTYFLEYDETINICYIVDEEKKINNLDDLCILGTPTLLDVFNNQIVFNISGSEKILNYLKNN